MFNAVCQGQENPESEVCSQISMLFSRHRACAQVFGVRHHGAIERTASCLFDPVCHLGSSNVDSFNVERRSPEVKLHPLLAAHGHEDSKADSWKRREAVIGSLTTAATLWSNPPTASADDQPFLDCLLDLPPLADDHVRIYLARHGQTENNRLRLVQGSRLDPPINENGILMANRMGGAFARLQDQCPKVFLHSRLLRAEQTAQVALMETKREKVELKPLDALAEVDFGPVAEGKQISEVRAGMMRTYGAWATGFIDTRPEGGGESGREVLTRAAVALRSLLDEANSNSGSVVAVAHSTYLRVLLASMMDMSLAQAAALEQKNGCINVLDLKRDRSIQILGPKSILLGGALSAAPSSFSLELPRGTVQRINEKRHLEGIPLA